ncbi:MAG: hypothetical protein LIP02_12475 [Bacteroidales bacterium]|nr:hypothetical protein [Bacteroidales bacterium]
MKIYVSFPRVKTLTRVSQFIICAMLLWGGMTSCSDDDVINDEPAAEWTETSEDEDAVMAQTTDQDEMEVTSRGTLYFINDASVSASRSKSVANNFIARYAKQVVLNSASNSAATGVANDALIIDNDDVTSLQADKALASQVQSLINNGVAVVFIHPTQAAVKSFFSLMEQNASVSDDNLEAFVYAYDPATGRSLNHYLGNLSNTAECVTTEYDEVDADSNDMLTAASIEKTSADASLTTQYVLGHGADALVESVGEFASLNSSSKARKALKDDEPAHLTKDNSILYTFTDAMTLSKDDYFSTGSKYGGTDYFTYKFYVTPLLDNNSGKVYYMVEHYGTMTFGNAYANVKSSNKYYKKRVSGYYSKCCEWAGYRYEWALEPQNGTFSSCDLYKDHFPNSSGETISQSSSVSMSFSGDITLGGSSKAQGKFGMGVSYSTSEGRSFSSVKYDDHVTQTGNPAMIGGLYEIYGASASYSFTSYGWVSCTPPSNEAYSSFCPQAMWQWEADASQRDQAKFTFTAEVTLRSYRCYFKVVTPSVGTKDKTSSKTFTLDLSTISFDE